MSVYKSHRTGPGRVFDHLYDPLYTTSGARDVHRQNYRSLVTSAQVEIYPVYRTMFTDSPCRPRNYYVPLRNPLPFLGAHAPSASAMQLTECAAHHVQPSAVPTHAMAVSGADRAKFFTNPISNARTITLRMQLDTDCACIVPEPPLEQPIKTIGCQTMYRVQSAQTNKWMPDAVICERRPDTPELVHVAELLRADSDGTMPGVYEAELVTRARKRRAWEKSLPAIATWEEWERRRVVLEAFEWEEWIGRENRIEYCQRLRLGIVRQLMLERKERTQRDCSTRVDMTKQRLEEERNAKLAQLRAKHKRRQRRLDADHKQMQRKYRPVDVATEHIDSASALYAPPLRFGKHPKHGHFVPFATKYVAKLEGYKSKELIKKPAETNRKTANEELQELYNSLQLLRGKRDGLHESPQCLKYVKRESSIMFATPKESNESIMDEQENQMAMFLQKLLKGRAIQKKLYNGRNKYRELIAEFQTSHQISDLRNINQHEQCPNRLTEDRKNAHYQQMRLAALLRAEAQIREVTGQAISTTISFALDLLESEMVRLIDQKKAHALCMLAETERYRREAVEAGHRQRGDNRRRFHEEVARSVNTTKQNTVCNYLENVLVDCLDQIAEQDARTKIRATVLKIDRDANTPTASAAAREAIDRFVLPDVFRRIAHENYLADVHGSIFTDKIEDRIDEQHRLNRMIEATVTPRDSPSAMSGASGVSCLGVGDDPAHHEAMHCIKRVIKRALTVKVPGRDAAMVCSILDDIVRAAIPDGAESVTSSARSQKQQDQLTEIVDDVKKTLLEYAKQVSDEDDNASNAKEEAEGILNQVTDADDATKHEELSTDDVNVLRIETEDAE